MTVKELIKRLEKCNQDARVDIVVGDEDSNELDTDEFEIHCEDIESYVELFVFKE